VILYCIFSSLINAITSLILGITVYSKNPSDPRSRTFAWMTITVAAWSAMYFCWQISSDAATALLFCRWLSAPAVVIPVAYYHFSTHLAGERRPREVLVGYVVATAFAILSLTPSVVEGVGPQLMFPFWPRPGPLYPAYLGVFFYYFLRAWQLLQSAYQKASFLRRNQILYVLVHTVIGFIGGAMNYFLWYGIPIPPLGNVLVAIYMIGVGYAVVRFRLMGVDLLLARMVAYTMSIIVLAAMVPLIVAIFLMLPAPGIRGLEMLVLVSASIIATGVLFWLIPLVRRQVDRVVEQRVLGEKLADRARLRQLAIQISSIQDEEGIFRAAANSVAEAMNLHRTAVYIRSEFETEFVRRAVCCPDSKPGGLDRFDDDSLLVQTLQATRRGALLEQLEHEASAEQREYFRSLRGAEGVELVVPIFAEAYFYGFLALGGRDPGMLFTEVDLSLLEAVGLQIGLNLRSRQLERQANQAEKLISLGTLAAGLAHELRNPLVSIQTFSALLKDHGHEPEFQHELGAVMQRDVGRIASIVENVMAFAQNSAVTFGPLQIHEVVAGMSEITRAEFTRAGVRLATGDLRSLPAVRGNYSQLLQVFLNLTQNALHALEGRPDGRIMIAAEVRSGDGPAPMLYLTFTDNGSGVDPAMLRRIFDPFTTTKSTGDYRSRRGLGLGLAIVKRIIQTHQGRIDVTSTLGQGTTFHLYLPCQSSS